MRKLWIALAAAVIAALAVAGVASAVNTYEVDIAETSAGKGTRAKPIPARLSFGYEVADTEGQRPEVINQYRIGVEGYFAFPDARPKCTFTQATDPNVTDPAQLSAKCRRAFVGTGTIANQAGAPNDRSQKLPCNVKLTLINISTGDPRYPATVRQVRRRGGIAIRIDTDPPDCPISVHEALAAPFYDVKLDGIPSSELRFTVPPSLAHPGGLDNSVVDVTSVVSRKVGRVPVRRGVPQATATRRVGFYSLVGRRGKTRLFRVTFVDESGARFTATTTDP
jgi:hypothetical protein